MHIDAIFFPVPSGVRLRSLAFAKLSSGALGAVRGYKPSARPLQRSVAARALDSGERKKMAQQPGPSDGDAGASHLFGADEEEAKALLLAMEKYHPIVRFYATCRRLQHA